MQINVAEMWKNIKPSNNTSEISWNHLTRNKQNQKTATQIHRLRANPTKNVGDGFLNDFTETLSYYNSYSQHWSSRTRMNNLSHLSIFVCQRESWKSKYLILKEWPKKEVKHTPLYRTPWKFDSILWVTKVRK